MPTAILIDGAFFVKRFRSIEPDNAYNASRAAEFAFGCAMAHLMEPAPRKEPRRRRDLYRIFFYDCPPLDKKTPQPHHPKECRFFQVI